jgi:hypothetical protein
MVIFYLKNNSKKTLRKIWSGIGKYINFATAKEETGYAPGNFLPSSLKELKKQV